MNFWRGVVLPAFLPAATVAGLWMLSLTLIKQPRARLFLPSGLMVGYLLVHILSGASLRLIPIDVTEWLPFVALIGALLGTWIEAEEHISPPSFTTQRKRFALFAACSLFLSGALAPIVLTLIVLAPLRETTWTGAGGWLSSIAIGILWWEMAIRLSQVGREKGWMMPLFAAVLLAINGGVLFYGRSALLGQLTGSFASAVGIGTLFALLLKDFTPGRGAMLSVGFLIGAIYLIAFAYAELPLHHLILLLLSWLTLSVSASTRTSNQTYSWRWWLRFVSLALALTALILGYTDYTHESPEYA